MQIQKKSYSNYFRSDFGQTVPKEGIAQDIVKALFAQVCTTLHKLGSSVGQTLTGKNLHRNTRA